MSGQGFRFGGTSIDRAGGLLRLRALADRLAESGREWRTELDEEDRPVGRLDSRTFMVLRIVDAETGEPIETLVDVAVARSASIREDQAAQLEGDELALEPIIRAEVVRRSYDRLPELEKRALDGDR